MDSCIKPRKKQAVLRLAYSCLSLGLWGLALGCTNNPHSAEHAEVSGKVLFQGQPLPGGQVTFVTVKGGFAANGTIDENGNYQIKAPVGDVEISVTNRSLLPRGGEANSSKIPKKAEAKEGPPKRGRYVRIPTAYENAATSGLKYTVKPGPQTHHIELSANPGT